MGKICLAMVVANERPVIARCLDSMRNLIDQICISINGDDDGTQKCIEDWGKRHNIPTTVWFDPWRGYGPTKTRNLAKVREEFDTEYIMFIDADEVFVTNPEDPLSYPTKEDYKKLVAELDSHPETDVFYFKSYYGQFIYDRWQIVRNNQTWIWHLPYQEFLRGEKSNNRHNIDWIFNYVRHEGHSSRHDDLNPNIQKLEKWAKDNPDSPYQSRALFYLGQGYKDARQYDKAINYFKKRLKYEGWVQEKYIAAYYIAQMSKSLPKPALDQRKKYLYKCIEIDPSRLEAYYELMEDAAASGNRRQAVAWGLMAPKVRTPPGGAFLAKKQLYEHEFDYKLSLYAYYSAVKGAGDQFEDTGLHHVGMEAINRCIEKLPPGQKKATENNIRFYKEKIQPVAPQVNAAVATSGHENTSVMIIENFYEDPYRIRKKALGMEFAVKGNYPGQRTEPYIEDGIKEKIERLVGDKITYWPSQYNGSFQYTTAANKSWIHRDATDWSLVVYLTPDAPADGGTKTYRHKETGLTRAISPGDDEYLNTFSYNHDAWDILDKVGNRFNRAVLFQGRNSHMSDQYFGTDINDGRLFQTFFFNTAKYDKTPKKKVTHTSSNSVVVVDYLKGTATKIYTNTADNVYERDLHWLQYLNKHEYKWAPTLIDNDDSTKTITTEYCGEPFNKATAPKDWEKQLLAILVELRKNNLKHNNIKADTLLVKRGRLYLVNYSWASCNDSFTCEDKYSEAKLPLVISQLSDATAMSRL